MNKIGVVLLNCNGGKFTIPCIQSLLSGTMKPDRIIVIDNASGDGSDNEIAARFPEIQLIRNKINTGFTAGNNIGITELINQGCKYVWVLNNDTELDSDCLKAQYDFLENNPEIAGCCGKILYSDSRRTIWYAGEIFKAFTLRVRPRGMLERDDGQYDLPQRLLFMTGCSMFVRSRVWQEVGAFDEKFFIYYEDLDWSLRAKKQNFIFWYYPKAVIYHKVSGTMGKTGMKQSPLTTPVKVTYLMQRNQIFIIKRWKNRFSFLFILLALEMPRLSYYSINALFLRKFDNFFALWRGVRDGLFDPEGEKANLRC
jgi:GT2 family glycosyltransferase